MSIALILDRIRGSLDSGELLIKPPELRVGPLTMAALTRPFSEVFPGVETMPDGRGQDRRDIWGWGRGALLKPRRWQPSPRRSRLPLPAPQPVTAPIRTLDPGIFTSVAGVWEWYWRTGRTDPELLDLPFSSQGLSSFVDPLWQAVSDYYPMGMCLEDLGHGGLFDLCGIPLIVPHTTYEEEHAGVVEAFLEGPANVASMLTEFFDRPDFLELPAKDRAVIQEQGFPTLCQCYADYAGEKSCDLLRLADFDEVFFGRVRERFPEYESRALPIISGDGGRDAEVLIESADTIDFCLAYAEAYGEMMGAMPAAYDMEFNEGGITETFIHELCEVWRKANGKRAVKWTSPKSTTLAQLYKRGEL